MNTYRIDCINLNIFYYYLKSIVILAGRRSIHPIVELVNSLKSPILCSWQLDHESTARAQQSMWLNPLLPQNWGIDPTINSGTNIQKSFIVQQLNWMLLISQYKYNLVICIKCLYCSSYVPLQLRHAPHWHVSVMPSIRKVLWDCSS
jgi:hypothetical protein